MQIVTQYPNGVFNWVDLTTTNQEGAKAFYSALFGWEATDIPIDETSTYTMFKINGHNVAGCGQMSPDMQAQGMPTVWTSYIKHDNVDAIAEKITAAGGTLMMPPMDVLQEGRMVMAMDPGGAIFGVWQPVNHIGAAVVNAPNSLVWNELQTHDTAVAQAFFGAVFGWTFAADANGYVTCQQDKRTQAGMMQIQPDWGDVPPNWAVYFFVEDLAAKLATVQALGGNILVPISSAGELGQFAVVQDPQGGVFTIMYFNGPIDPPPGY